MARVRLNFLDGAILFPLKIHLDLYPLVYTKHKFTIYNDGDIVECIVCKKMFKKHYFQDYYWGINKICIDKED